MARVGVVGGGVGGLATALFLARRGHDVTVLERDGLDIPIDTREAWATWSRPGVPQFRQIHLFNARGRTLLRDEAPDVLASLRAAGAGEIHLDGPDEDELVRLTCRRTTFELVLRRAALAETRLRFVGGASVGGLLSDGSRITGVRTEDGREWVADVVVDASGRRSSVAGWLAALGLSAPEREEDGGTTIAYTRWYRLRGPEDAPLLRADLGYAVGVVAPADDGMFCVTFGCLAEDPVMRSLRDPRAFDAATAAIPTIAAWTSPDRVSVESGVLAMADRSNRLVRVLVPGIVLLGDSAVCTNPGYGRGVGLALVHASRLADVLSEVGDNPSAVTTAFDEVTRTELAPWYHAAVASDRVRVAVSRRSLAGESWEAIGGPGDDPAVRFARGAPHAVECDPVVRRAFHRCFQLLDPPSAFWGNADIGVRVEDVWREMDACPPPRPGPDHEAMGRLLARATGV